MKRMIALIVALLLLLTLGSGCGGKKDADEEVASTNPTETETTDAQTTEQTEVTEDAETLYAPLIEAYREAIVNFDRDSYDLDINDLTIYYYNYDYYHSGCTAGYTLYDINRDGTPELVIGTQDEDESDKMRPIMLGGIYTLQDGKPKWLIGSIDEISSVRLLKDERILETSFYWGKEDEFGTILTVYKLSDSDLSLVKTYYGIKDNNEEAETDRYVKCYSTDKPLSVNSKGELITDEMQPMEPSAYQEAKTAIDDATFKPPITLFFE